MSYFAKMSWSHDLSALSKRISTMSSVFDVTVQTYQNALAHINFNHKLEYMPHVTQQPRRIRPGNIIWFNPDSAKTSRQTYCTKFPQACRHALSSRPQDTHFQ